MSSDTRYWYYFNKENSKNTDLINAVVKIELNFDGYDTIKYILNKQPDEIDKRNCFGKTAVLIGCENVHSDKRYETVKILIDAGADINISDNYQSTPLMKACSHSGGNINTSTVKLLIDNKADVNAENCDCMTPLMYACTHNDNIPIINLLIDNKANVNVHNDNGESPLMIACKNNNTNVVKFLLKNGSRVDALNQSCISVLQFVCEFGCDNEIINIILDATINSRNQNKISKSNRCVYLNNSLEACIKNENIEMIKNLIEEDYINLKNSNKSHLMTACKYAKQLKLDIIKILLDNGVDVNTVDTFGNSVLMTSITNNDSIDIIDILIQYGCNVNTKNIFGNNALYYALKYRRDDVINLLIDNDVDCNTFCHNEFTPLMLCIQKGLCCDNVKLFKHLIPK